MKHKNLLHIRKIERCLTLWQQVKENYELINLNIETITLIHKECGTKITTTVRDFNKYCLKRNFCKQISCENNKRKKTFIKKYGVDHPLKCKSIQDKTKKTCQEKYGVDNPKQLKSIIEKEQKTNLEKYGHICNLHGKNSEKTKQIILEKYGTTCIFSLPQFRLNCHSEEANEKRYETMKKNNSCKTSKQEEKYYEKIKQTFPDVIRNYRDKVRYPFRCDFYIPSNDTFIELNLHWTHGFEPFDPNNLEHQKRLMMWNEKAKTSKYYKTAIDVWTVRDVMKRKVAEKNNIMYIELFNII